MFVTLDASSLSSLVVAFGTHERRAAVLKDVALNLKVLDTKIEQFMENTHVKIVMQDVDEVLVGFTFT